MFERSDMTTAQTMTAVLALVIITMVMASGPRSGQAFELEQDKYGHFTVFYGFGAVANYSEYSLPEKFAMAMTPGVLKEVYDSSNRGNRFDLEDLKYDALGVMVGMLTNDRFSLLLYDSMVVVHVRF